MEFAKIQDTDVLHGDQMAHVLLAITA